ncbi:relaxase/mobilization nuclease domain-containing protein [Botryobacter ruber]|uniref:relaxase/mobilization nuclease domain-containing protein n=1 Tax=Botryobacter ruber TaxID=2171629 RepID=UPI000E0A8ED5|nr:relaxase/mobilization nuclease domain-containing protein [Botryobacter ruber]
MIGKVIIGKSFGGCVRYVVQKAGAVVLDAEGIRTEAVSAMVADFNLQRQLNPNLEKAVGHLALSWSTHDKPKLDARVMVERAREYMEKMHIRDTQYLIVEHRDREHPHVHIVYNRVNYQGQTISDKLQRQRNAQVCREITLRHGYYLATGKEQVNRQRLKGADKEKYVLHDAIHQSLEKARNWKELEALLQEKGIRLLYKYRSGTDQVQGISFSKGELSFKGSGIARSLSYNGISKKLEQNRQQSQPVTQVPKPQDRNAAPPDIPSQAHHAAKSSHPGTLFTSLKDTLAPAVGPSEEAGPANDYPFRKNKKKRKKRKHL